MSAHSAYPADWDVAFVEAQPPQIDPDTGQRGTVLEKGAVMYDGGPALSCDIRWDRNLPVEVRDGAVLRVDVLRPADAAGPVPAILAWSPYGKSIPNPGPPVVPPDWYSGLAKFEGPDPDFWVRHGYAVVNVAARGDVVSDGDIHFWGRVEAADGYDIIEWSAAQKWCSGRVALHGTSWLAISQWFIAAARPPHLAAIAPWNGFTDVYRDHLLVGGIPDLFFSTWAISRMLGSRQIENPVAMVTRHDAEHPYWKDKAADIESIQVPAYVTIDGATTLHRWGLEGFRRLPVRDKWLRVNNTNEWFDQYHPDNQADLLRFFDHYLKGTDNGWPDTPRARISVFDAGGEDRLDVPYHDWPVPGTDYRRFHLDARNGGLQPEAPDAAAAAVYDADGGSLTFTFITDRELQIVGYIWLRLWVEADGADDMDLFVLLEKCSPDGTVIVPAPEFAAAYPPLNPPPGTPGRIRVSRRAVDKQRSTEFLPYLSLAQTQKLTPGEVVPVDIAVLPVAMRWHTGQQLRLTVAGHHLGSWEVPTVNAGRHILHTGPGHSSWLQLPVVDPVG